MVPASNVEGQSPVTTCMHTHYHMQHTHTHLHFCSLVSSKQSNNKNHIEEIMSTGHSSDISQVKLFIINMIFVGLIEEKNLFDRSFIEKT